MEEFFVPYNLSLKLKEKGFVDVCLTYYKKDKYLNKEIVCVTGSVFWNLQDIEEIGAPLYEQVLAWFRKKHIHICPSHKPTSQKYGFSITGKYQDNEGKIIDAYFEKLEYNEALNKAIEEALKLI